MAISVFDLFKIGIGPSSSHTVGPMRAARKFAISLDDADLLPQVESLSVELFGSLGATGIGHGTDRAILLGLEGEEPAEVHCDSIDQRLATISAQGSLSLLKKRVIAFHPDSDLMFKGNESMPYHSNGMRFSARDAAGETLDQQVYYSIGGGFVVQEAAAEDDQLRADDETELPFRFSNMAELLKHCADQDLRICEVMMQNEMAWRSESSPRLDE